MDLVKDHALYLVVIYKVTFTDSIFVSNIQTKKKKAWNVQQTLSMPCLVVMAPWSGSVTHSCCGHFLYKDIFLLQALCHGAFSRTKSASSAGEQGSLEELSISSPSGTTFDQ